MNAADFMDNCDQCDGTGYLVGQSYGDTTPLHDDGVTIQRCDECERWAGDIDAAAAYAEGQCIDTGREYFVWAVGENQTLAPASDVWVSDQSTASIEYHVRVDPVDDSIEVRWIPTHVAAAAEVYHHRVEPEPAEPGVIFVLRDPDASNEVQTFGLGEPTVIDIDLGRADLYDDEEWSMWIESHRAHCAALADPAARAWYERVLSEAAEQFGHEAVEAVEVVVGGDGVGSHADCDENDAVADLSGDGDCCWICGEPLDEEGA